MAKLMSFILALSFAAVGIADSEVPLPGPGAPPTEPPPPQPTPPVLPAPTPPPNEPYPTPTPPPHPTPPQNPGDTVTYTLGVGEVGRFKERRYTFRPPSHLNNIRALRLTCTNSKLKIKSVQVQFANGQVYEQSVLHGIYKSGYSRVSYMTGSKVARVMVIASSSSVFKSNGAFRLDAVTEKAHAREAEDLQQPEDGTFEEYPAEDFEEF